MDEARTAAARYRCEFVDLKEVRIDHELFSSVPVDLMFRHNFVPLKVQRDARYRAGGPEEPQSD